MSILTAGELPLWMVDSALVFVTERKRVREQEEEQGGRMKFDSLRH
ncbi:TPA_asm: hypothetical protein [Pseudomonas phage vB_PaeS-D14B]|nr:TPA_asm: hypothetical protein [Pseudomonas phage vB_PaeS-D14B]